MGHGGLLTDVAPAPELEKEGWLLDPDGPKVVAIGGGHGLAAALEAVQLYAGKVTAIVSVADDGGSSGRLTGALSIPAPGDIRRCLLALSPEPSLITELFAHRFTAGDVNDHSLGNLMLAALADMYGDFEAAVSAAGRMLGAVGDVIPASTAPVGLRATVDGRVVEGQVAIALSRGTIESIELTGGEPSPSLRALEAIAGADQIVLGPGSLYTSVIATLLVPGLAEAVSNSPGRRVFVSNLVTQDGETWELDGAGHLEALAQFGGVDGPGMVLAHDGPLDVPVGHSRITYEDATVGMWGIYPADVADPTAEWPAHDPFALARVLEMLLA